MTWDKELMEDKFPFEKASDEDGPYQCMKCGFSGRKRDVDAHIHDRKYLTEPGGKKSSINCSANCPDCVGSKEMCKECECGTAFEEREDVVSLKNDMKRVCDIMGDTSTPEETDNAWKRLKKHLENTVVVLEEVLDSNRSYGRLVGRVCDGPLDEKIKAALVYNET